MIYLDSAMSRAGGTLKEHPQDVARVELLLDKGSCYWHEFEIEKPEEV